MILKFIWDKTQISIKYIKSKIIRFVSTSKCQINHLMGQINHFLGFKK